MCSDEQQKSYFTWLYSLEAKVVMAPAAALVYKVDFFWFYTPEAFMFRPPPDNLNCH